MVIVEIWQNLEKKCNMINKMIIFLSYKINCGAENNK